MDGLVDGVTQILSANRAEELGYDVWEHFVIPPFYPQLDLLRAGKPRLIIGGRGCGKTMLLRYLSHQSMFSRNRPTIPIEAFSHVGLYWRTDTHFANAMYKRELEEDRWQAAFNHMAALLLSLEALKSLESITASDANYIDEDSARKLNFRRLQAFDPTLPVSTADLRENLEERVWAFESWVNDVRKVTEPRFLPGEKFILALISEIHRQISPLRGTTYYVYVDEYENLLSYQKRIINTWLKHSEKPLIFNLAMKRHAFDVRETTGPESLSDIHDFRQYDLEGHFLDELSAVFFAEILLLQLSPLIQVPINVAELRDPSKVSDRQNPEYVKRVLEAVESLLPDVSEEQLARGVFDDPVLANKLKERLSQALKQRNSKLPVDSFFKPHLPKASIVVPPLLHRKRYEPSQIANKIVKLETGKENRFTGPTNWIHNNFIGSILQLYEPHDRACPFYGGFRTFLQLSHGNIRHFLELCHKSVQQTVAVGNDLRKAIPSTLQAEAARQASIAFLGEVRSFGPLGNKLHTFVLRLGSLFAFAHLRPTLSESEQSHFSITSGGVGLTLEDESFLREAVKWSVLYEERETKAKVSIHPKH